MAQTRTIWGKVKKVTQRAFDAISIWFLLIVPADCYEMKETVVHFLYSTVTRVDSSL